ncbi:hypothetical protein [Allorhizobium ampelinum]|uniref:hypothetical protein n=1 Tax=Allorhizobium ampelinum TaxID=3025782 RepID=UPI000B4012D2|nr:hypothetical protein [Allorhizobium ampelinum]NTA27382.1 hypothetical protein [Allorhizobium ampelinum]OVE94438.1 hypothetical protein B7W85_12875 [Allorhizobium ampelinum]
MTVIISIITWLARMIGWGGIVAIGILIYEEGIPIIRKIPYIEYVPLAGEIAEGRVKTYAAEQVKIATAAQKAQCEADKNKMVSDYQYAALQSQLNRERELRVKADQAASEAQKLASDTLQAKEKALADYSAIVADDKDTGQSVVTEEDLQWLKKH